MSLVTGIAIYLLIWALAGFLVLPFGVRTSEEAGVDYVPGQAESAPHMPMMAKKLLATTLLAAAIFAVYYANAVYGWIGWDDILPGLDPRRA